MRINYLLFLGLIHFVECNAQIENKSAQDTTVFICFPLGPSFPGGADSLFRFVKRNLKYPRIDINGKVFVRFVVNEDGSVSDFEVLKGLCDECDRNAVDVLRKMPKWIPQKMNGHFVKQKLVLPVKFNGID